MPAEHAVTSFILKSLVVLASLIGCSQPHDDVGNQPEETSARANAKLLFVREGRDIAFDGDTLTMNGVQSVLEGGWVP